MRRRKIAVLRDPASTDAELAAITYKNRKKRLQFNLAQLQEAFDRAVWADDLLRMPDGSFSLMAIRRWGTRRIGVGWKVTDPAGVVHLFWTPTEDLLGWGQQMEDLLKEVAAKYLIPPAEYSRYLAS